jgi:hypothetical protein
MGQNLDLNVNVNTNEAGKSLGSLKTQLKEAQAEVTALSDKFGATSKEAIEAAKRAGELKDRIGDAKALTDAFNPDAKFKALTASLSGVAGGFAAVQGAMGLLGAESEDAQKMLLKVQSAMAISQGLQSVGEAVDSFKNLGAVIKSTTLFQSAYNFVLGQKVVVTEADVIATEAQTVATVEQGVATVTTTTAVTGATTAMKAFRIALIASGIGLLIVGLGLAIEALSKFSSKAEDAAKKQGLLNKQIADGAKLQLESEIKFLDNQEKLDIARAKAKGASEQEIFNIEQGYRKQRAESHQRHYEEVYKADGKAAQESADEINKINTDGQVAALENQARIRKEGQEAAEKRAVAAALKEKKAIDDELAAYEKRKKGLQKGVSLADIDEAAKKDKAENDKKDADKQQELLVESNKNGLGKMLADKAVAFTKGQELNKQNADAEKLIDEATLIAKQAQFQTLTGFISNLGSAFEQGTAVSKTAAIAEIGINTALGYIQGLDIAQKGAKATGPLAPFTMPIFYASQILAVIGAVGKAKQALSQVKGGSGSIGSISSAAPMTPQLPQAATTNLSRQTINDIGNQAVRAYVIETDVTSNQERMAAIRQRARFS